MKCNNPFISKTYIKGFLRLSLPELKKRLYSIEKCDENFNEIIYFFTKTTLNYHMFFNMSRENREYLIFESARWASKEEAKSKRVVYYSEEMELKNDKLFTKLTKSIILAFMVKHKLSYEDIVMDNEKSIMFNLELNNVLSFMYNISCIKRDKNKNKPITH